MRSAKSELSGEKQAPQAFSDVAVQESLMIWLETGKALGRLKRWKGEAILQ